MDIQTNHINVLLNAKCEVVCAAENLIKKSDYGDDIECCSENIFAAVSLINRLDCYCFEEHPLVEENIDSIFRLLFRGATGLSIGTYCSIKVDGVQLYSFFTDTILDEKSILIMLFEACNIPYQYNMQPNGQGRFFVQLKCFNESLSTSIIDGASSIIYDFQNIITGQCSDPSCFNCIKDSDLNKMYEVLDNLLK